MAIHHQPTSSLLRALADAPAKQMPLGDLSAQLASRGFGLLLLVLALPNALPIPVPGISTVTGLLLLVVAAQLFFGQPNLWLPKRLAARPIDTAKLRPFLLRAIPIMRWLERFVKPRLLTLTSSTAQRLAGLMIALLSLLVTLPIPFGNMLPGIAIALMALAMIERDGLLMLAGWFFCGLTAIYCVALLNGAAALMLHMIQAFV